MGIVDRQLGGPVTVVLEPDHHLRERIRQTEETATKELDAFVHVADYECSDYRRAVRISRAVFATL